MKATDAQVDKKESEQLEIVRGISEGRVSGQRTVSQNKQNQQNFQNN